MDLLSEIKVSILPMLLRSRSQPNIKPVINVNAYIHAVALNTYRQYLREKYPNRLRLRNKIRYILGRRPDYALWTDGSGTSLCGLNWWVESGVAHTGAGFIETIRTSLSQESNESGEIDNNENILNLVAAIFESTASPVALDDMVSIIWDTLGLRESQNVSETDGALDHTPSKLRDVGQQLDDRQLLDQLWEKTCTMPLRHRRALFLNLRDENGDNLIVLLPQVGIASIRQIAAALEYEPEDFAKLWAELPLDDLAIADRMGLTRQQVINLRQSARASLRRGVV